MKLSRPQEGFGKPVREHDMPQERVDHAPQVEAVVEAVAEGTEVTMRVLAEKEVLVGTANHRLEVPDDGVHPLEDRQLARLALSDHHVGMRTAGVDDRIEARQSVAAHVTARQQVPVRPLLYRLTGEAAEGAHLHPLRSAVPGEFDGGHEGHLVRRAATGLAGLLPAQVGIIQQDVTAQRLPRIRLGHRLHHLVVQQPGAAVGHPELAHQGERRDACLGLADEVDGEEPGGERELGAVHQRARRGRGLMAAGGTLQQHSAATRDAAAARRATLRAAETLRPAQPLERRCALRLAAVLAHELTQRHPLLELHSIDGHDRLSWLEVEPASTPTVSPAEPG